LQTEHDTHKTQGCGKSRHGDARSPPDRAVAADAAVVAATGDRRARHDARAATTDHEP
jgi:hypothetical protein